LKVFMKTKTDINERWETGVDHHPQSQEIFKAIAEIDFRLNGDSFYFKSGGDGDNGESLMYLMDVYFDAKDNGELEDLLPK